MQRSRLLPAALATCFACSVVLGFAACSGDDDTTTVTETEVATESTSSETETTETQTSTEALPPSGPGSEGPAFFSTPSGNIACHVDAKFVRCDIAKKAWKPTPPSEPCELDYGNGIQLGSAGASFTCAGDTTLGAPDVLDYGERSQRGLLFCESAEDGVTCSNSETGAGFFISRQSYRIF